MVAGRGGDGEAGGDGETGGGHVGEALAFSAEDEFGGGFGGSGFDAFGFSAAEEENAFSGAGFCGFRRLCGDFGQDWFCGFGEFFGEFANMVATVVFLRKSRLGLFPAQYV